MGATLANRGINPFTGKQAVRGEYGESILSVKPRMRMARMKGEIPQRASVVLIRAHPCYPWSKLLSVVAKISPSCRVRRGSAVELSSPYLCAFGSIRG